MANIVMTGASRGLGSALLQALAEPGDRSWLISRTEPPGCDGVRLIWLPLDLSVPGQLSHSSLAGIDAPIHLLIHSAGIWEDESFEQSSPSDLLDVLNVNLTSAVLLVRLLERKLRAGRGNIVFIGSTWGLEDSGTRRVASAASKFGLRGAAHALREHFRDAGVRVTCINSGWFAHTHTDAPVTLGDAQPMPVADIVALVRCITRMSAATCVKELTVTGTTDPDI